MPAQTIGMFTEPIVARPSLGTQHLLHTGKPFGAPFMRTPASMTNARAPLALKLVARRSPKQPSHPAVIPPPPGRAGSAPLRHGASSCHPDGSTVTAVPVPGPRRRPHIGFHQTDAAHCLVHGPNCASRSLRPGRHSIPPNDIGSVISMSFRLKRLPGADTPDKHCLRRSCICRRRSAAAYPRNAWYRRS